MKPLVRTEDSAHRVTRGPKPNTEPSYLKKTTSKLLFTSSLLQQNTKLPWCLTSVFSLPEGMFIYFLPKHTVKIVNI